MCMFELHHDQFANYGGLIYEYSFSCRLLKHILGGVKEVSENDRKGRKSWGGKSVLCWEFRQTDQWCNSNMHMIVFHVLRETLIIGSDPDHHLDIMGAWRAGGLLTI